MIVDRIQEGVFNEMKKQLNNSGVVKSIDIYIIEDCWLEMLREMRKEGRLNSMELVDCYNSRGSGLMGYPIHRVIPTKGNKHPNFRVVGV